MLVLAGWSGYANAFGFLRRRAVRVQEIIVDTGSVVASPSELDGPDLQNVAGPMRIPLAAALVGCCTFLNLYAPQPLLPLFVREFGVNQAAADLTVGASLLAIALAGPFVGVLADAVGRKRVIVAAMFALAITTMLAASARSLDGLIVWRFLQGLAIPGIIACTIAYISEESPLAITGRTMAIYVTGTVIGGFCGRFIAGLVAAHTAWQYAFVVLGAMTFAGTIAVWSLLPRSKRFRRQPNAAASLRSFGGHLCNPQLLATYAVGFSVLFTHVACFNHINYHLAAAPYNLSTAQLGSVFFVYLIGAVITPLAGKWIDRIGYRRTLLAAVAMGAAGTLLTLARPLTVVIAGLTLMCTGIFVCNSAGSGYVGRAAHGSRSAAAGLYVAVYFTGGFCGSWFPRFLPSSAGWTGIVVLILIMQVITAAIAGLLWHD